MSSNDNRANKLHTQVAALSQQYIKGDPTLTPEIAHLVQELYARQLELEVQNKQLHRLQEELNASRERYLDLYDFAPVGYCTVDENGRLTEVNLTLAALLGVARSALITEELSHFILGEDQGKLHLLRQRVTATQQSQSCELRMRRSDGALVWVHLAATAPAGDSLRVSIADITETKARELYNNNILDSISDHLVVLDDQAVIRAVNLAWLRFAADNGDPLLGSHVVGLDYLAVCESALQHPNGSEASAVLTGLRAVMSGHQEYFELEYPCHSPTEQRWFLMTISPLTGAKPGAVIAHKNITARKQAELALRRSETLLRSITESTSDAVFVKDLQGRYLLCNSAACRFAGKPAAEVLGNDDTALFPPEQAHELMASDRRIMASGRTQTNEERLTASAGATTFSATKGPLYDEQGKLIGMFGISRDITARKQIEENLERTSELLERAGQMAKVGGWELDLATTQVTYSKETARIHEVEHPYVSPKLAQGNEYYPPRAWPIVQAAVQAAIEHGTPYDLESPFITARGRHLWVRVQGFALQEHDKTTKLYGTIQDITARKQAEERLRESEENLSLVMRSIGDAIITTDAAGLITHLNPTAEQLAGRPLAAAAGHALQRVFPFIEAASLEAVLTSGQSKNSEAAFLAADGTNRWFSTDLNPLRHQEKIAGAVIICRDVTEKRRVDEQLLASDRMASVGILAAGVAHEINNPLAVILANLDFCINDEAEVVTVPELSNNLLEGLIDAHHCAERIRIIVRDLLLFSRAEEDLRQPVDTTRILGSVLRMAQNEIRHRARLRVSHGDIPFVQANEARLGQVFTNLIMNAIQAMPKGQAEANELRVSTKLSAQGEVVISIEDTGLGMSPEVQRRLFTPFFTTKPIGQGTGLGLSICRRIVSNLGGRIELESMLGKGSVFRVFLPASPAKEAPSVKPPAAPTATIQSKLLLIDDETMLVSAIHKTFSTECEVVTSKNGKEALQLLLGGERFDAILCDLMMPDLTGIELHTALLQNAPDQAARMIFMTGDAFNENAATFFEHVPNQRIEKPFRLSELRDLVREHLRKHASHNDPLCQS